MQMDVIRGAVDDQSGFRAFRGLCRSKEVVTELWFDERKPALRAENHVQQDIARYMRQCLSPRWGCSLPGANPRLAPWAALLRRFAASLKLFSNTQGLRPGLHSCAASRTPCRKYLRILSGVPHIDGKERLAQ